MDESLATWKFDTAPQTLAPGNMMKVALRHAKNHATSFLSLIHVTATHAVDCGHPGIVKDLLKVGASDFMLTVSISNVLG